MKTGIIKVRIHRAKGPTDNETMREVTFEGPNAEEEGNSWLRRISLTAPSQSVYDDTDVWVTLADETELNCQFDVRNATFPDNYTDIRRHVRNMLLYRADPEKLPWVASNPKRLIMAKQTTTDFERTEAKRLLEVLG